MAGYINYCSLQSNLSFCVIVYDVRMSEEHGSYLGMAKCAVSRKVIRFRSDPTRAYVFVELYVVY